MKQKDRVFVTHLEQSPASVGHEEGVSVVNRVPELEREDGVGATLLKLFTELGWRKPETVKPVVVLDGFEDLEVTTDEPVSSIGYRLFCVR